MVRVMDSVARNKNSAKKKKKKQQQRSRHKQVRALGFVRASAPGCHVADSGTPPAWVLGCEVFDPEDYGACRPPPRPLHQPRSLSACCAGLESASDAPDLTIDPDEGVLTVINASDTEKSYYVSTECDCFDGNGVLLAKGAFR